MEGIDQEVGNERHWSFQQPALCASLPVTHGVQLKRVVLQRGLYDREDPLRNRVLPNARSGEATRFLMTAFRGSSRGN